MAAFSRSVPDRSLATKVAFGAGLLLASRWLIQGLRRYDLRGRTAIVTGGARGLGLDLARVLVEKGAQVALVARDDAEIERALLHLRGHRDGARAIGVACDVTKQEQLEAMLETVRRELGPIDVLINNAGKIEVGPLEAMTAPDFETAMALHCYAPLHAMLAVRAEMSARGGGRIANIASVGGLVSMPHLLPYCTSKFALIGLSEGMHAALAQDGIVVSTIAPGLMRTGSPRLASFKGEHADSSQRHRGVAQQRTVTSRQRAPPTARTSNLERYSQYARQSPLLTDRCHARQSQPELVSRWLTTLNPGRP
jgi:NAD(P)-dependent dehydrogenase (short-subunit alcohol dehydrogenase family)